MSKIYINRNPESSTEQGSVDLKVRLDFPPIQHNFFNRCFDDLKKRIQRMTNNRKFGIHHDVQWNPLWSWNWELRYLPLTRCESWEYLSYDGDTIETYGKRPIKGETRDSKYGYKHYLTDPNMHRRVVDDTHGRRWPKFMDFSVHKSPSLVVSFTIYDLDYINVDGEIFISHKEVWNLEKALKRVHKNWLEAWQSCFAEAQSIVDEIRGEGDFESLPGCYEEGGSMYKWYDKYETIKWEKSRASV